MSQVGIRHHWQSQMPISEYVPLPSYLLVEVLPIVIISCHLIYLRFLLRNPLKAQCTYQVECCYIDPQLEFAKSWETLHLYIKQFACCSRWAKALLWAGSANKKLFMALKMLTDTLENSILIYLCRFLLLWTSTNSLLTIFMFISTSFWSNRFLLRWYTNLVYKIV